MNDTKLSFDEIHALMRRGDGDYEEYVEAVTSLDEDTFWKYVRYEEDKALEKRTNGEFPVVGASMMISTGKKNRQFTEIHVPNNLFNRPYWTRNLGQNIQRAYALVRAAAGVHIPVDFDAASVRPYNNGTTMDFGKYQGTPIEELKPDYVLWLWSKREEFLPRYRLMFDKLEPLVRKYSEEKLKKSKWVPEEAGETVRRKVTITALFRENKCFFGITDKKERVLFKGRKDRHFQKGDTIKMEFTIKEKYESKQFERVTVIADLKPL